MPEQIALVVEAVPGPGVLHQISGVIARLHGDITCCEILTRERTYFEIEFPAVPPELESELRALSIVKKLSVEKTLQAIYGKRIIIMGGGAQVGQVAIGAISEADRHNIRGEHISVDTSGGSMGTDGQNHCRSWPDQRVWDVGARRAAARSARSAAHVAG